MKMLIVRPKTVTGFKNHEGNMREHGGNMAEMLEHDGNMRGTCGEQYWTIFEQYLDNIWAIFGAIFGQYLNNI